MRRLDALLSLAKQVGHTRYLYPWETSHPHTSPQKHEPLFSKDSLGPVIIGTKHTNSNCQIPLIMHYYAPLVPLAVDGSYGTL